MSRLAFSPKEDCRDRRECRRYDAVKAQYFITGKYQLRVSLYYVIRRAFRLLLAAVGGNFLRYDARRAKAEMRQNGTTEMLALMMLTSYLVLIVLPLTRMPQPKTFHLLILFSRRNAHDKSASACFIIK